MVMSGEPGPGLFGPSDHIDRHPSLNFSALGLDRAMVPAYDRLVLRLAGYPRDGFRYLTMDWQSVSKPTAASLRALITHIQARHGKELKATKSQGEDVAKERMDGFADEFRILAKIIQIGNGLGVWSLPFISDVRRTSTPPHKLQPEPLKRTIRMYRVLRAGLREDLRRVPVMEDRELAAGRFLLLLLTENGAVSDESLAAASLEIRDGIKASGDTWYLDLFQQARDGQKLELRRQFLEPYVIAHVARNFMLLREWSAGLDACAAGEVRSEVRRTIRRYASTLTADFGKLNLAGIRAAAGHDYRLRMPPFVVEFAERGFETHSSPEALHRRMLLLQPRASDVPDSTLEQALGDAVPEPDSEAIQLERASAVLRPIRAILDSIPERAKARRKLEGLLDDPRINDPAMVDFVRFLIHSATVVKGRKAFQLSTMRLLTSLLGRRWVAFAPPGYEGVETLTIQRLQPWFRRMYESTKVADKTTGTGTRLLTAMTAFAFWLISESMIEEDETRGLIPGRPSVAFVSANWVNPLEIASLVQSVRSNPAWFLDADKREVSEWLIELASRLGLRRGEAIGWQLSDLHDGENLDLVLRPNALRSLKSVASSRRCPVDLCGKSVASGLCAIRCTQPDDVGLKSIPWTQAALGSHLSRLDNDFVPALNLCMQECLGGEMHFHHLRHSAANIALLALVSRYLPLDAHTARFPWLNTIIQERDKYERLLGRDGSVRRDDLWAVAGLVGHSSPEVTLRHYIHVMDLLLHVASCRFEGSASDQKTFASFGIPHRTFYRSIRDGWHGLVRRLERQWPQAFVREDVPLKPGARPVSGALYLKLEGTCRNVGLSLERSGSANGPDVEPDGDFASLLHRASLLHGIPAGRRGMGSRHPMSRIGGVPWPSLPKSREAAVLACRVASALENADRGTVDMTRNVLAHWSRNALVNDDLASCRTRAEVQLYADWLKRLDLGLEVSAKKPVGPRARHYVRLRQGERRFPRAGLVWLLQMLYITDWAGGPA